MTREDIIRMAREALVDSSGFNYGDKPSEGPMFIFYEKGLERFAALVAAAEREECAKVCDAEATIEGIAQWCAAAIRARGEKNTHGEA